MPDQPVPNVTADDVERVIRRDFPASRFDEVLAIVCQYGTDNGEPHRVRLATLKLAAGNIAHLRAAIETAKLDYRDVLAAAEYPQYFKRVSPGDAPSPETQRIIDSDWRQYQDWLRR